MILIEGAKISQSLINAALADPNLIAGFEVEFYLSGIGKIMQDHHLQDADAKEDSDWVTKPLRDATWRDVIRYFYPLNAHSDTRTNQEVMVDRLQKAYAKKYGDERAKPSDQFQRLRQDLRMYHVMTLLRIFPAEGMWLTESQQQKFRDAVSRGNATVLAGMGDADAVEFAMFQRGEERYHFNAKENSVQRTAIYDLLAQHLEDYLGEPVVSVEGPRNVQDATNNYQTWAVTYEESLEKSEDGYVLVGVELVSPARQAAETRENLMKVLHLMQNPEKLGLGEIRIVTARTTGLHVTVSFGKKQLDFMKLLVLLGDDYMLKKFQRTDSEHARSTLQHIARVTPPGEPGEPGISPRDMQRLIQTIEQRTGLTQTDVETAVALLKKHLPSQEQKFHSVNTEKLLHGLVEFRAMGSKDYHMRDQEIDQTLLRIITVLYIATEPRVYRKEYLTKLTQIIMRAAEAYREREDDLEPYMFIQDPERLAGKSRS